MTATPTCKPWCTDHKTRGENSCYTSFAIYDDGSQEKASPAPGSMAALFQAGGGLPADISRVAFVACQDEEDELPVMHLEFFEAGEYLEQNSHLYVELDGLRDLHSSLGAILKDFSQPA